MGKLIRPAIIICVLFLVGCATVPRTPVYSTEEPTMRSTPGKNAVAPPDLLNTTTPISETLPSSTVTYTPFPDLRITPSLTQLPTLDNQAAEMEIAKLMRTNNSCEIPCFWGISPGKTKLFPAISILQRISSQKIKLPTDSKSYDFWGQFLLKEGVIKIDIGFHASVEEIEKINVKVSGLQNAGILDEDWSAFRPNSIMKSYGIPTQVNIIMGQGPEGRIGYEMVFLYRTSKMYIRYSGNQLLILPQKTLHVCPLLSQGISEFELGLGNYDEKIWTYGKEVSQFTIMNEEDIYNILLSDPQQACFDLDYSKFQP